MSIPPSLSASGIRKRFGPLTVLDDVSLSLRPGGVHALLGENGAGKSTLVKCIMGYYTADSGRILRGGQEVRITSPRHAQELGIGMVYQHFTLVPNMSVAENFVLSRAHLPAVIDWRKEEIGLRAFMDRMPFRIEPSRVVRELSAGERQKLEILKQLYLGNQILILDEPTSVLTPSEADEVLGMLRNMARAGEVSVLMITHKFREVMSFAEEVTVLRRGRIAGVGAVSELTPAEMARMMVGGDLPPTAIDEPAGARRASDGPVGPGPGPVRLAIDRVGAADARGIQVLDGVSLEVRSGEIVGIAGVSGNGQEPLFEIVAGQRELDSGEIRVEGRVYGGKRAEARAGGVRCLPEEPLRNGCVATMTVAENLGFRVYDRPPFTWASWLVRGAALRRHAGACIRDYGIRAPSVDAPISELSGGNVQRVVLARELENGARVLVVTNPCFGLDFAAVREIRARLRDARNRGVAVLLISSDLDEVFALSDRILVMSGGKIAYETAAVNADLAVVGRHMAGGH
ncbi:MAG: ABC transporter ATP-binding protein [Polyangiaceae bacterium]